MKRKTLWFAVAALLTISGLGYGAGEVTKGLIGLQDLYRGPSSTFTRTTSSGYDMTLSRIGVSPVTTEIYPEWFGENTVPGVTDMTAAIKAAVAAAIPTTSPSIYHPSTYAKTVRLSGHYMISSSIVIPESIGFQMVGDGIGAGMGGTTIQWGGADLTATTDYMLDARSVLGFRLKGITLIGQADVDNVASNCIQNGIITGRYAAGSLKLFNSDNDWDSVTVIRFPGVGITFGRYAGYTAGAYPDDTGQTDNSYFENIWVQDCRVGIVINSPNFLQCHFNKLTVGNYGGNPVAGDYSSYPTGYAFSWSENALWNSTNAVPVEDATRACPIKFRTKNAVQVLYGRFEGTNVNLYASYNDADPWSQYGIYVLDGAVSITNGHQETHSLAYITNGANDLGNQSWPNTFTNILQRQGAAGGPVIAGKDVIYNERQYSPVILVGCTDVTVTETADSGGTMAFGTRNQRQYVSAIDRITYKKNPRSIELGSSFMTADGGKIRWATNNIIGQGLNILTDGVGKFFLSTNLVMRNDNDTIYYMFQAGDNSSTTANILYVGAEDPLSYHIAGLTNGQSYTWAALMSKDSSSGILKYPTLITANGWSYVDGTRKAGYILSSFGRTLQLFGCVTGGSGYIFALPTNPSSEYTVPVTSTKTTNISGGGTSSVGTATSGTNTTTVVCSGCDFTTQKVQSRDYLYNSTRSLGSSISSVDDNVTLSLDNAIAAQTSGDSVYVYRTYVTSLSILAGGYAYQHTGNTEKVCLDGISLIVDK